MANQTSVLVATLLAEWSVEKVRELADKVDTADDLLGIVFIWGMASGIQLATHQCAKIAERV